MDKKKLQKQFEKCCTEYIKVFSKKQGLDFDYWIADDIGGIACFGDWHFNFSDIVWDINSEQPEGAITEWQNEVTESGKTFNYYSYTKGLRAEQL